MTNQKIKYCCNGFLIILSLFIYESCSGSISGNSKTDLKIKLTGENAWLNLMPGGNSTFHFTGKLEIINTGRDTVKNLKLAGLEIYRDSALVYKLNPVLINSESSADFNLPPQTEKHFTFQLPKAIKIKKEISDGTPINARFVFSFDGGEYVFNTKIIKVEKVY